MSFTSNIEISKQYPAVQYNPSETSGVWHEAHEVSGAMYSAANATFDDVTSFEWKLVDISKPAYAVAQNTDGSVTYLYMPSSQGSTPWPTSAWLGTGQPVIYHVVNYGMSPNATASVNTAALQAAVTAALNGGGGIIFIPAGTYQLSDVTNLNFTGVPGNDPGFVIAGAGASTVLKQTVISKDVFSISGVTSGKGVRFKDLSITYQIGSAPTSLPAAIRVNSGCKNVSCERVYFKDCPQAFYAGALECGLFNCRIDYDNFSASGTVIPTMVNFSGAENYIDNCVILQQPRENTQNPGPTGCIGVLVNPGGGAYFITNTHLSDFTQGIVVKEGEQLHRLFCSNVICESWTNSLYIQPSGSNGTIYQIYCGDCVFARTNGSTDTSSTGVYIDTAGGTGNVGEIFLNNCTCFQWNGPGVQINAGQNIVITGGRYGSNATSLSTSGGIAITGAAQNVTINGADLTPKLLSPTYGTQPYAISITAAPVGLYIRGCNMAGYAVHGPLYLSSPGTQIEITDCAGYNDQGTVVSSTAPPTGTQFNGTYSGFSTPYFGPVTFYTKSSASANITHIKVSAQDTNLQSGTFSLAPGSTNAEIDYTGLAGAKPLFLMIGE